GSGLIKANPDRQHSARIDDVVRAQLGDVGLGIQLPVMPSPGSASPIRRFSPSTLHPNQIR
ncbi:hypothetical protein, partial [Streptomyces sp. NPDC059533]|uniref:hypothetical protein n=1 Tax=Streptomyces sp. NPDC059533 TaxID=3346858 RepID=UPI0036932F90